jgi:hypothetical protein
MTRIIDISDETKPKVVSKLMLEVNDPANCHTTIADNANEAIFDYDVHYCNVDNVDDTHYVACGHFQSGIRVFDVSDPANPRNVAYYVPPARETNTGSNFSSGTPSIGEWAGSKPQFHNGNELWVATMNNGFQVLRFTNGIKFGPTSDEEMASAPVTAPTTEPPAPVKQTCRTTLKLRLKAPKGKKLRRAVIIVNGRRAKTVKGKALRKPVKLRKLNRRSIEVRTVLTVKGGRRYAKTRVYRLCR